MYRVIVYDDNGVPRLWSEDVVEGTAIHNAMQDLNEYKKLRPDIKSFTYAVFDNLTKPFSAQDLTAPKK